MTDITGYRQLSPDEVEQINDIKEEEANVAALVNALARDPDYDQRSVALARTNLQQGFMWLTRAVARPNDGWTE